MNDICSVYAVFGSAEEAERISRAMVERRLAACANILGPCRSVYRWDGAVTEDEEVPAIFKTTQRQAKNLIGAIAEMHSYDVPAIVQWPIDATLQDYARWVQDETDDGS